MSKGLVYAILVGCAAESSLRMTTTRRGLTAGKALEMESLVLHRSEALPLIARLTVPFPIDHLPSRKCLGQELKELLEE